MTDKALEAALPGEAEVVAWHWEGRATDHTFPVWAWQTRRPDEAPNDATALVTLASLQAMQARAENAERERDEAREIAANFTQVERYTAMQARAEAAEARVKELEEALEPFADVDAAEHSHLPDETPVAIQHEMLLDLTLRLGHFRRARTALKGGSNG